MHVAMGIRVCHNVSIRIEFVFAYLYLDICICYLYLDTTETWSKVRLRTCWGNKVKSYFFVFCVIDSHKYISIIPKRTGLNNLI